jgi:hypothetical protein
MLDMTVAAFGFASGVDFGVAFGNLLLSLVL